MVLRGIVAGRVSQTCAGRRLLALIVLPRGAGAVTARLRLAFGTPVAKSTTSTPVSTHLCCVLRKNK